MVFTIIDLVMLFRCVIGGYVMEEGAIATLNRPIEILIIGGSWKVAYADFVTAMRVLFLLLWILAMTNLTDKAAIAQYFRDSGVFKTSTGVGRYG